MLFSNRVILAAPLQTAIAIRRRFLTREEGFRGNRLGRGGGYYDRFLALVADRNPDALFIGVCWSGCVVASVPVGPNDIRVRMLLTEHGLERCRG